MSIMEIQVNAGMEARAQKLLKDDLIQEIDQENYVVLGSKGNRYNVQFDEKHGLVCKLFENTDEDNSESWNKAESKSKYKLCPSWKMSTNPKICKHCFAVVLFKRQGEKN